MQILCSPNLSSFKWIKTNDKDFYLDTINKYAVKGGVQAPLVLHLGRTAYDGEVPIGKIWTASPLNAPLYFPTSALAERNTDTYQALIYEPRRWTTTTVVNIN